MQFNKMTNEKTNKLEKECLRVLIVDDNQENLDAARNYFNTVNDAEFLYCSSPKEAQRVMNKSTSSEKYIDYALIDLEMPGEDGEIDPVAGHMVSVEAWKKGIINVIVTQHFNATHGGNTTHIYSEAGARGGLGNVSGKKDNPDTWKKLYSSFNSIKERYAPLREVVLSERKKGKTHDLWEGIIKGFYNVLRNNTSSPLSKYWEEGEYEYK